MGQKVNPHGMRVGVISDWDSRWFTSKQEFGDTLVEDNKIRKYLKKQLYAAGVPKIEIERTVDSQTGKPKVKVNVLCSKPGIVIGKGGAESAKIEAELAKMTGKTVSLNIVEVRNMSTNAQLVAEDIASQLERRIAFRRAMKQSIRNAMQPRGGIPAKGIKTQCSGRLAGADIARVESYHEGTIPLQTMRADIDYGFAEANTTYGKVGVKVWVYKGEILKGAKPAAPAAPDRAPRTARPAPKKEGGNN
jgi:small subunit ribosomal protein S3